MFWMSAPQFKVLILETLKPLDDEGNLSKLGLSGWTCEGYTQFSFLSRLLVCYDVNPVYFMLSKSWAKLTLHVFSTTRTETTETMS